MVALVLVRVKEIPITPATLFLFWWPDVPVPEVDPTYQKPPLHKQYVWVVEIIAIGSEIWAQTEGQIYRQDLHPEATVWFHLVRKNLMASRDALHV